MKRSGVCLSVPALWVTAAKQCPAVARPAEDLDRLLHGAQHSSAAGERGQQGHVVGVVSARGSGVADRKRQVYAAFSTEGSFVASTSEQHRHQHILSITDLGV